MNAGRKREFDKQETLDKAMRVFWARGYSGTSLTDLTTALGINKPSLYAAFGNKEQLFRSALNHYMTSYGAPLWDKLLEPPDAPLETRLRAYLYGIVDLVSEDDSPKGCLFVRSMCESGGQAMPEDTVELLRDLGQATEKHFVRFLKNEQSRENLSTETDVKDLAKYIMSVMYGLAVLVKNGSTKKSLRSAVNLAVDAVPTID